DGSTDNTFKNLSGISKRSPKIKSIKLKQNQGQTFAISTGVKFAKGDIIILMDSDLQNDPEDIPKLIYKIEKEGFDVVSGWRFRRKDAFFTRIMPSKTANFIISIISGVKLKDYGCTLKAYRKEYIKNIKLYGEMHRFIPIYAKMEGARITEVKVNHHPRKYGKSKYGLFRIFKVILDLLVVKFIKSYYSKPIYFFGGTGLLVIGLGFILSILVLIQKFFYRIWAHKNPLMTLAVMLFIIGFQFILFGVLAEIEIRTYFEVRKDPHLLIEKKINIR
ncbi:MAG: glycosyltransferase family 2 protein, partial [Spirochaetes bacterium]|nr:glycosyltransferase family 2 protein [Spirochaetota bacterium]